MSTFLCVDYFSTCIYLFKIIYIRNEEVHSGVECVTQSRPAGEQLTLQSSQHCPWAHTASPNRVQVVALQHGFIHSWNKERKIKYLTTSFTVDYICQLAFPRWRLSGQGSELPVQGILALLTSTFKLWRPLNLYAEECVLQKNMWKRKQTCEVEKKKTKSRYKRWEDVLR